MSGGRHIRGRPTAVTRATKEVPGPCVSRDSSRSSLALLSVAVVGACTSASPAGPTRRRHRPRPCPAPSVRRRRRLGRRPAAPPARRRSADPSGGLRRVTISASGIAFDARPTVTAPAGTRRSRSSSTTRTPAIPHNVADPQDGATAPRSSRATIFTGVATRTVRRARPRRRHVPLRLHRPPEHDRHAHGAVAASAPMTADRRAALLHRRLPPRPSRRGSWRSSPARRHLVVLDRTVFYPGGGGQPSDRGLLLRAADGRSWTVRARPQGRRRDRPRARARRRRPAGGRRRASRSTSTGRAGWP